MNVFELSNEDNMDLMARYPDNYFDLALVDPPYGIGVNMNAGRKKDTRSKKRSVKKWDKKTPNSEYFQELFRVSKNQVICGANYMTENLPISMGWIFWDKCVAEGCSFSDGELIWTSFNQSLKKTVIPYSVFIGMEGEKIHPTQKPIKLYEWILKNYAKPNDKILDTHLGSMSIALAVHNMNSIEKMNLTLTGCELDKEYFDSGIKRLEQHKKQLNLF